MPIPSEIPSWISHLTTKERVTAQERFEGLAHERAAPVTKYPRQQIWWPSRLEARAIPEGILPRSRDEGFEDAHHLTCFFSQFAGGKVLVGDLGDSPPFFKFTAKYGPDLCRWIKSSLVSNPTCLFSVNEDLLLIADEQLRYSVVGATPELIAKFEKAWGGRDALRSSFVTYVCNGELGFDDDDREWAKRFLIQWSGW